MWKIKSSASEFIKKAQDVHGNLYDYHFVSYTKAHDKVKIVCLQHGIFLQTPNNHLQGRGCKTCANIKQTKAVTSTTDQFIRKAMRVHGDRYDYHLVSYTNHTSKVNIICKIHGMFKQVANDHLSGSGCSVCGNIVKKQKATSSLSHFINKANIKHHNKYDYSQVVYINNRTHISIVCAIHGLFRQLPNNHLLGRGCPACSRIQQTKVVTSTTDLFVEKANKKHKNKYDYSKVKYVGVHKHVTIICPSHGEFIQSPSNHLQAVGCSKCANEQRKNTTSNFIEKSNSIHNNKYDYSNAVYSTSSSSITITCPIHGEYAQIANDHLQGSGCSKCTTKISKPEQAWLELQNIPDTKQHRQVRIKTNEKYCCVDGFIPETNTVYEFWGDFWHGNPVTHKPADVNPITKKTYGELYEATMKKRQRIIDAGYNLVEIWESDWNKLQLTLPQI